MENFHIIRVKHIGQTNTKLARVSLRSERFKDSVIMSHSNEAGSNEPAIETAENYLLSKGFEIIGRGEGVDGFYIITNTFKTIK